MNAQPRTLVTGGTGFIGLNLTAALLRTGRAVRVIARHPPDIAEQLTCFRPCDVLDYDTLQAEVRAFDPTEVVHLAAQTDFVTWEDGVGYRTNTQGTSNLLRAVAECSSVRRFLFASSHVIHAARPGKYYAQSKIDGELIVREALLPGCAVTIIRPCSIWGPWFRLPFRPFFTAIARGRYYHLGNVDPPKRLGYVGNTCHQIIRLLDNAPDRVHGQTFYLSDYEAASLRTWATTIARHLGVRHPATLPEPAVRLGAWAGDALKCLGIRNPPLSSVRLANMRADTSNIPTDAISRVAGPLPFTLDDGVKQTVHWLRHSGVLA